MNTIPESIDKVPCRGGKRKTLPPVEFLRECLEYRPDDQIGLYWALRPRHHFTSDGSHKAWNARFSGKPAGNRFLKKNGARKYVEIGLAMGRTKGNKIFSATHIIMTMLGREIPYGHEVHHIDFNPWNNSLTNLEIVTPTKNNQEKEQRPMRTKASGLPIGIYHDRTSYGAKVTRNGVIYFVGNFRTVEEAVLERAKKLEEIKSGKVETSKKKISQSLQSKARLRKQFKPLPSQEFLREALDLNEETGVFTWRIRPRHHFNSDRGMNISNSSYAGKVAGVIVDRSDLDGAFKQYVMIGLSLSKYYAHRLVYAWRGIEIPDGMEVDHGNGIGTDNRTSNLTLVTSQRNNFNSGKRRTFQRIETPRGVQALLNGTFLATLKFDGVNYDCGTFPSVDEALNSRRKKAEELGIRDWVE